MHCYFKRRKIREHKPMSSLLEQVTLKTPAVTHLVSNGCYKTCTLSLFAFFLLPQTDRKLEREGVGQLWETRELEIAGKSQGKPESF